MNMEYPFKLENRVTKVGNRKVSMVLDDDLDIIRKSTGEIKPLKVEVSQKIFLDGTEFVKIYNTSILMKLNITELKVFLYLISVLKFGGEIYFKVADCMNITGLSRAMVYRGINGLEKYEIVKKVDCHLYYINWNIAYRGNRDKKDEKENR